ncbi:hypothetical protein CTI12_AA033870 [Artemisia annua]|uniref:Uncharacterized protein n=1 Tax=Artemisia annua TaxID=35608 RepID=A0A2U1QG87_ARTAN|nr:hypothetical protein CTI12_AA033870 [Artemisia annua]
MQPQRSSQRLSKAKEGNTSEKQHEEKEKSRMNSEKQTVKKVGRQNSRGKQQLRKGSHMNRKEPNNVENDVILVDQPERNHDDISENILVTPGNLNHENFGIPKQGDSYRSNLLDLQNLSKGKTSSSRRNVTDSERQSYIKYQQKDPRSTFTKGSSISQQYKGSAISTPSFGYQENDEGLHMSQSKRSLTGGKPIPKNRFGLHSQSFESGSTGMKTQIKKGYGMQSSSIGIWPQDLLFIFF